MTIQEIKKLRKNANVSQKVIAKELGISKPSYSAIESEIVIVDEEMMEKIGEKVVEKIQILREIKEERKHRLINEKKLSVTIPK